MNRVAELLLKGEYYFIELDIFHLIFLQFRIFIRITINND